jgi:hypothetical protein
MVLSPAEPNHAHIASRRKHRTHGICLLLHDSPVAQPSGDAGDVPA